MQVLEMIASHPEVRGNTNDKLIRAIEELLNCGQVCTSCADACLAEEQVAMLVQCIRLDMDCADLCFTTARVATRRAGGNVEVIAPLLTACIEACRRCGDECGRHARAMEMEHCRICAEACRRCEQACQEALGTL